MIKKRRVICDIEANGFLPLVSTIWCVVFKDIDTGEVFQFRPHQMKAMMLFMETCCGVIIGHNFLDYDIPVLKHVLGFELPDDVFVIDTYILSQILEPDRKKHPKTEGKKGPHSLENFGNIFRRYKPEHEDWSQFSEDMLHRCTEDVEINYLTFKMLNRKADIFNLASKWWKPYKIEAAFAKILVSMKRTGFLVNKELIEKHITTLTDRINIIDAEVVPKLPKRIIINEQKADDKWRDKWEGKHGISGVYYKYNAEPFKGNGELNQRTMDWITNVGIQDCSVIGGPFSRVVIQDFDLGSSMQVKEYLLEQGWIPDKWNIKEDPITGEKIRTSPKLTKEDPFIGVTGDVGTKVAERMIFRHRRSQLEGFLRIIRPDGRITANVTGITPTARLKHSGIVNIPGEDAIFGKEMREVFIAPEGYKIVGCDAASCQLRMLCHHMGDPEYTEAVVNGDKDKGTDMHSLNMRATGITNRRDAKSFIYGFLFGAGDEKIGIMINGTKEQGKKTKDTFLNNLPKLKALIERVEHQLKVYGYIHGLDGREVYPRSPHEALCYLLQSDEAILMKVATIYAHKWIEEAGLDARMVAHMHDEMQWEVRDDHAEEVGELLKRSIVKAGQWLKLTVPADGDPKVGQDWWSTH